MLLDRSAARSQIAPGLDRRETALGGDPRTDHTASKVLGRCWDCCHTSWQAIYHPWQATDPAMDGQGGVVGSDAAEAIPC